MHKQTRYLMLILALMHLGVRADDAALATENQALKSRVSELEARLDTIESLLRRRGAAHDPVIAREVDAIVTEPAASALSMLTPKQVRARLYGYIKTDAVYDSSRLHPGNLAFWAVPTVTDDDAFNLTANESRVGLALEVPGSLDFVLTGHLEADFYGGGSENSPHLRLRHAYARAEWANGWSLLGGQTWDLISSLNTPTLNFAVGGHVGNIGFRRPQVRLTRAFELAGERHLELALAATRTIGRDGPYEPGDTGEDAGFPSLQARAGCTLPHWVADQPAMVAIFGHWGQEEYDTDAANTHQMIDSWSFGAELSLPITEQVQLLAECFTGQNLDALTGGIGQGINPATLAPIATTGGWLAVRTRTGARSLLTVGYGIDDPHNHDLAAGMRSRNQMLFGNFRYDLSANLQLGVELAHFRTDYVDLADADALRLQSSMIFSF